MERRKEIEEVMDKFYRVKESLKSQIERSNNVQIRKENGKTTCEHESRKVKNIKTKDSERI